MITRTDTWCFVRRVYYIIQNKCDSQTEKKTERIKKPVRMRREDEAKVAIQRQGSILSWSVILSV